MNREEIVLEDGKYTMCCDFGTDASNTVYVLRYGDRWRDVTGDKFILAMMHRIQSLETEIKKAEARGIKKATKIIRKYNNGGYCGQGAKSVFINETLDLLDKKATEIINQAKKELSDHGKD